MDQVTRFRTIGPTTYLCPIPAVMLGYGDFINTMIQFVIVAFAIFMLVKAINRLSRKKEEAPAAPAEPSEEVLLLREIRDNLKR